jgi:hypothetical protein
MAPIELSFSLPGCTVDEVTDSDGRSPGAARTPSGAERVVRRRAPSMLDPFVDFLAQRWRAGCRNAAQLWREIRERGYPGSPKQVALWVYERREQSSHTTPKKYLARGSLSRGQLAPKVTQTPDV